MNPALPKNIIVKNTRKSGEHRLERKGGVNYAIILAGGIGSRFWPLSRELEPKQFLNICSSKPMIEEAVERISRLIERKNIYIATNKVHHRRIRNCLRKFGIPKRNVLFEPEGKNTLAPIAFLSKRINSIASSASAVCVALPCDHFVRHNDRFLKSLSKAIEAAALGYIVTLGMPPSSPETGYGYIRINSKSLPVRQAGKIQNSKIYKIDKFIEKPPLSKARKFIQDKRFFWNSGIFIFRPDVMLGEIKAFMPRVHKIMLELENKKSLDRLWHKLPSISVDYAIMERTKKAVLLPVDYGWIDLGSWQAIEKTVKKDKDGNIFRGNCINIGSKNTLIWSDNRLVSILGLNNIIIVNTQDALLVCSKDRTQDVKKVVQILKQKKFKEQI